MKSLSRLIAATALVTLAGCATGGKSAAELRPGKFVTYTCEGNKTFQVRFDAEVGTARIRTHQGSAELSKGARGLYRDDDGMWVLSLVDGKGTELVHKGKAAYKNCAAQ